MNTLDRLAYRVVTFFDLWGTYLHGFFALQVAGNFDWFMDIHLSFSDRLVMRCDALERRCRYRWLKQMRRRGER